MTGVDDPYEPPVAPDLVFDQHTDPAAAAAAILRHTGARLVVTT